MYLHLGGDVLINQNKIISIIDLESIAKNGSIDKFLKNFKNNDKIIYVSEPGKEKSFIITDDIHYFSPISSTTLLKRSSSFEDREE